MPERKGAAQIKGKGSLINAIGAIVNALLDTCAYIIIALQDCHGMARSPLFYTTHA